MLRGKFPLKLGGGFVTDEDAYLDLVQKFACFAKNQEKIPFFWFHLRFHHNHLSRLQHSFHNFHNYDLVDYTVYYLFVGYLQASNQEFTGCYMTTIPQTSLPKFVSSSWPLSIGNSAAASPHTLSRYPV